MQKPIPQKLLCNTVLIGKRFPKQMYNYLKSLMDNFLGTLGRYGTILKLITIDSIWRFKKESFLILVTSFLGVFFQVGTIGMAIYYAQALAKGNDIKMLGYMFQTRNSIGLLFVCGTGVLLSLLLSAWLIYFSRTRCFMLSRRYEEFCSKRILSLFGSNLKVWAPPGQRFSDSSVISRLVHTDSRNIGRVLWMLLNTIIPAITLLVSVGALFYTNTPLTFLMLVLFGISSIFQYKISVMSAKNFNLQEQHARGSSLEYQQIILRLEGTSLPLSGNESGFKEKVFTSGKIKRYLDARIGHLKAIENSQLVSNILFAITIFVLLLTLGSSIILKGAGWGNLIVYLVALRFVLVNMKQISKKVTGINRFYPQIKRYFQFVENTTTPPAINGDRVNDYCITTSTNTVDGSLASFNISKGYKVGLISGVELNRYTLVFIIDCLLGHSKQAVNSALSSIWFMTSRYEHIQGTFRESLGLPGNYEWQDLCKEVEEIETGLLDRLTAQLPNNFDEQVSHDKWNTIDKDLKYSIALLNALRSNKQWVVIEENVLQSFSDNVLKFFTNRLSDRILVVIFYSNVANLERYREDVITVMPKSGVIGMGSVKWFMENQQKIKDIIGKVPVKEAKRGVVDIDSDDKFEDEDI
mgnify:CR=1 FL=1